MESSDVAGLLQQDRNMAEAAVESPVSRFFCHKCTQEICPVLPDYTCPHCQGGFIEEVEDPEPSNEPPQVEPPPVNATAPVHDLWQFLNVMRRIDDLPNALNVTQERSQVWHLDRDRLMQQQRVPNRRIRLRQPRRVAHNDEGSRFRTEFIQQLVTQLQDSAGQFVSNNAFPVFLNLASNPGDYAWGRGSWNAIITQLINQLDGTGPPPMPKDKIKEIPQVQISQEQVDKNLQCTVCMEDFQLDESVRKLTCDHHFHDQCIIPWLELHATCPICRKVLSDGRTASSSLETPFSSSSSTNQPNNPEMMDFTTSGASTSSDAATPASNVYDFRDETFD